MVANYTHGNNTVVPFVHYQLAIACLFQPNPVPLPLALKGSSWTRCSLAWSRALSHHTGLPPLLSAQAVAPHSNIFLGGVLLSLPMGQELGHKVEWAAFRIPECQVTSACPGQYCGMVLIGLAAVPLVK